MIKFKDWFGKKEFNGAVSFVDMPISYNSLEGRSLLTEGYNGNVIVYRCVQKIIQALQSIDIMLINSKGDIVEDSDLLKLLNRPNPVDGRSSFLEKIFISRLVLGEMFVSANIVNGTVKELWDFPPLEMKVVPGNHIPSAYIHKVKSTEVTFPVDAITGESEMFYWKGTNPLDMWRGISPLKSASLAADTNNAGLRWNHSLLKNGARGSGILTFDKKPAEDAYKRLREWWRKHFQGEHNAGEVPILIGGKFEELGKNPKDMDFVKTLNMTTSFIATAYGVPLPLILNDSSTFNNMREAKEMFYTDTVIPTLEAFLESFGNWIIPKFKDLEGAHFKIDKDSISALEALRSVRRESMRGLVKDGVISPDEARVELSYDERGGAAAELYMPASNIPIDDDTRGDGDGEEGDEDDEGNKNAKD